MGNLTQRNLETKNLEEYSPVDTFLWFEKIVPNLFAEPDSTIDFVKLLPKMIKVTCFGETKIAFLGEKNLNCCIIYPIENLKKRNLLLFPKDSTWLKESFRKNGPFIDDVLKMIVSYMVPTKGQYTSIGLLHGYKMMHDQLMIFGLVSRQFYHCVNSSVVSRVFTQKNFDWNVRIELLDKPELAIDALKEVLEVYRKKREGDNWWAKSGGNRSFFEESNFPMMPGFSPNVLSFIYEYLIWKLSTEKEYSLHKPIWLTFKDDKFTKETLYRHFAKLFYWRIVVMFTIPKRFSYQIIRYKLEKYLEIFSEDVTIEGRGRDIPNESKKLKGTLDRMLGETEPEDEFEKLIYLLRFQNSRQWGQPGGVSLEGWGGNKKTVNHYTNLKNFCLKGDGNRKYEMLPKLSEHLLNRTVTRTVSFHRDFHFSHHLWGVWKMAKSLIEEITGLSVEIYTFNEKSLKEFQKTVMKFYKAFKSDVFLNDFYEKQNSVTLQKFLDQYPEEKKNVHEYVKTVLKKMKINNYHRGQIIEILVENFDIKDTGYVKKIIQNEFYEGKSMNALYHSLLNKRLNFTETEQVKIDEQALIILREDFEKCEAITTYFILRMNEDAIRTICEIMKGETVAPRYFMKFFECMSKRSWEFSIGKFGDKLKKEITKCKGKMTKVRKELLESGLTANKIYGSSGSSGDGCYSNLRIKEHVFNFLVKEFKKNYPGCENYNIYKSVSRKRLKMIDCAINKKPFLKDVKIVKFEDIEVFVNDFINSNGDENVEKIAIKKLKELCPYSVNCLSKHIPHREKEWERKKLRRIIQKLSLNVYGIRTNSNGNESFLQRFIGEEFTQKEIVGKIYDMYIGKREFTVKVDRDENEFGFFVDVEVLGEMKGEQYRHSCSCVVKNKNVGNTSGCGTAKSFNEYFTDYVKKFDEKIREAEPKDRVMFHLSIAKY